jgi:large subunit ribosomal protein L13
LRFQTALAYHRAWHHVDARGRVLGKLAARIALVLMGKHKPIYDPGGACDDGFCDGTLLNILCRVLVDCGDYVTVTNSRAIVTTGQKETQKVYRHHTMYPGGLKEIPFKRMMEKKPEEVSPHLYISRYLASALTTTTRPSSDCSQSRLWNVTEK